MRARAVVEAESRCMRSKRLRPSPRGPRCWSRSATAGSATLTCTSGRVSWIRAGRRRRASQAIDRSGAPAEAADRIKAAAGGPVLGVLDLVNSSSTIQIALACLARGGKTVQVGMFGGRLDMPLMAFPRQGISICGNFVGNPKELCEVVALAREGRLRPIPVETRAKSEAIRTLQELRDGKITGRVVRES